MHRSQFRFGFVWPELDAFNARARLGALYFPAESDRPQLLFFAGFFSRISLSSSFCSLLKTPTLLGMDLIWFIPGLDTNGMLSISPFLSCST